MDAEEKTKYDPNIVSSTVYIICLSLQVATIAVNYKVGSKIYGGEYFTNLYFKQGHPFMESLRSNRMLMYAIGASATLVILLSTGLAPELTEFFEIIHFPTEVCVSEFVVVRCI